MATHYQKSYHCKTRGPYVVASGEKEMLCSNISKQVGKEHDICIYNIDEWLINMYFSNYHHLNAHAKKLSFLITTYNKVVFFFKFQVKIK